MKILLATSAAIPSGGGIASYNQELLKVLSDDNSLYLLTDANEQNVDGFSHTESTFGKSITSYEYIKDIVERINDAEYDLIINSASSFLPVICPFLKAPIISVSHYVNGYLADKAGYNSQYQGAIISLSEYGKEYLINRFNITECDKIHVVYNFVHPKKFQDNHKESSQELSIIFPGGTSIHKSFDVVLEAALMLKKTALNFRFIWLGVTKLPSAKFSLLKARTINQFLGNDSRFEIKGKVARQEAEALIASSNMFVLPSRGEGCPMTLLEAMRGGCIPVISDAKHGSIELINMCGAGIVVPQNDSKLLFSHLTNVILHHSEYTDYYEKTRQFSESRLSPELWRKQMINIISQVANSSKKIESLNKKAYKRNLRPYRRMFLKYRLQTMIDSAVNRMKMDWLYLNWIILNK